MSRIHTEFILSGRDNLKIQDAGSKYGTFYIAENGEKVKLGKQGFRLTNGARFTLGILGNEWEVHHVELVSAMSLVSPVNKQKLVKILDEIGVAISDEFNENCSHLTMTTDTTVSHKLLQALSSCKPVVTPKYWTAVQESIRENKPLPKAADFTPVLKDDAFITPGTVSLQINSDRKKLFASKTFVFFSSTQMESYKTVIMNAGGVCVSLSRSSMKPKDCCRKNTIVIQPPETESQAQNSSAIEKLQGKHLVITMHQTEL